MQEEETFRGEKTQFCTTLEDRAAKLHIQQVLHVISSLHMLDPLPTICCCKLFLCVEVCKISQVQVSSVAANG